MWRKEKSRVRTYGNSRSTHLGNGLASYLKCQKEMLVERAAHLGEVHFGRGRVVGAAGRDHHMVDGMREVLEEPLEVGRIGGVKGRRAERVDLVPSLP
jgi:hypothetical protein